VSWQLPHERRRAVPSRSWKYFLAANGGSGRNLSRVDPPFAAIHMHTLQLILLLLAASVVVVVACRQLRLPPILGYLLVGVIIGPHMLGWFPDVASVRYLAEFGIVFLMFSIGLEFSLPQLKAMRRAVFGLGLAQVAITTLVAVAVLGPLGVSWQSGMVLGGALAMSSTAIVSKMLAERNELA